MSLLEKVKEMLGFGHHRAKPKCDYIGPDVSRAVQRNEQAGENARKVLEEIKMTGTMRQIAGKMK